MFQESQTIGYYTLIRKLGEGGFGEVWLAENRNNSLSEKVAIKLPRKDQIDLQAVKDEIFNWILSGKHKNILPIIECETFGNQIAIVSEFAPDGSLKDLLKKHGSFSVADAVEIVIGILDGLAHLHNRKIIHRDLKPDNVLFQGRTPRLTDFGVSRALPIDSQSQTVTGTLSYMAPEAFDGKRNAQTDIWSVGVVLYQLLTGNLPFPQKERVELMGAIVMREPKLLLDSIPPVLQKIVAKALAKIPPERYLKASEMREELQAFFNKESNKNVIFINSPIDDVIAMDVVSELLRLESENSKLEINMYINVPFGSSVTAGMMIYDMMQFIKNDVKTVCVGECNGLGALLLAAGTKGKRFSVRNARIIIRQPSVGASGQAVDVRIMAEEIIRMRELTSRILAHHTGQSYDQIELDVEREKIMSATQAKEYGIIDIVTNAERIDF